MGSVQKMKVYTIWPISFDFFFVNGTHRKEDFEFELEFGVGCRL